jgi:hypothetical protein
MKNISAATQIEQTVRRSAVGLMSIMYVGTRSKFVIAGVVEAK